MELAEEYFLSPESVKKIVYGKKKALPEYSPTVYSARQYSDAGIGEEWVRIYLDKNSLDMPYCMNVKGDSAYYEFGGITTGYARISKEEYEDIFASQKKAAIE